MHQKYQEQELKLLQKQHLQKMILLEKERELLNRQNPYRMQFDTLLASKRSIPSQVVPILKPDTELQRILYIKPNEIRYDIADKSIQAILNNWKNECNYIPNDIHLRNSIKKENDNQFEKQLSHKGKLEMSQMLQQARRTQRAKQISIRDKYTNFYKPRQILSEIEPESNKLTSPYI